MNQIVIQGIGYLALFFSIVSFQQKKRSLLLFYLIISQILFAVHLSLLQAWTGVAMNAVGTVRAIIFSQKETKAWARHVVWMYIFLVIFLLTGLITWTNYTSLLPIIAMMTCTLALWRKSPKAIRLIMLFSQPPWLLYDFLVGSYPGVITEVFSISSLIIAIFRLDIPKSKWKAALKQEPLLQQSLQGEKHDSVDL